MKIDIEEIYHYRLSREELNIIAADLAMMLDKEHDYTAVDPTTRGFIEGMQTLRKK